MVSAPAIDFRCLVDRIPDLILRSTLDGTLLYVNESYATFFGTTPEALIGTSLLDPLLEDTRERVEAHFQELVQNWPEIDHRVNQSRVVNFFGEVEWHEWTDMVVVENGEPVGFFSVGRDVTARVLAENRVGYLAERDALTGLLNRRATEETTGNLLAEHRDHPERVGLLFGDIDGFKAVNDQRGHAAGDEALRQVAQALRTAMRSDDKIGRMGGDEFVILLNRLSGVDLILSEVRERLDQSFIDRPWLPRISFGRAIAKSGDTPSELFARADRDMYSVKRQRQSNEQVA